MAQVYSLWICPPAELSDKLRRVIQKCSIIHDAIAFGLIKFGFGETFLRPVSLLIVNHALRLNRFISVLSTVDIPIVRSF